MPFSHDLLLNTQDAIVMQPENELGTLERFKQRKEKKWKS